MLTLTREQGESIYLGRRLHLPDPDGTCDFRIDFDVVDHRVGHRRIEVAILAPEADIQYHTLTTEQPDVDFATELRLAFLRTYEYCKDDVMTPVARIGIRAPRYITIMRDNAHPILKNKSLGR